MPLLDIQISDEDINQLRTSDGLTFDIARSDILKSFISIDVQACPGSGKTTLIAAKLLLLSRKWQLKNRGICVLSHTNVAKNEILKKIENSGFPEARRLLSYPHFIGTIQEFVNKYIGIPYLRSNGVDINLIDTERCVEIIYSKLSLGTKGYIDRKSQHENVLFDFNLSICNGDITIDIPTFPNGSDSDSYKNLKKTRSNLLSDGYLFYRDLYVYADKLLMSVPSLPEYLQRRFPMVLIDEMQDTQKFQDDLLHKVFPPNSQYSFVQRFGDPDQAIFNGINDEVSNETYNVKSREDMSFVIDKSYRFDYSISNKIVNLSFNEIKLSTDLSDEDLSKRKYVHESIDEFQHTILIFNDGNIQDVLPEFASIVSSQFNKREISSPSFVVKAVGAVGKEFDPGKTDELKIGHYFSTYDKEKSKNTFKGEHFMDDIYHIRENACGDWAVRYTHLLDSILRLLRFAKITDQNGKYFNAKSLKEKLIRQKQWRRFRKISVWFINGNGEIAPKKWKQACSVLGKILDFNPSHTTISAYLSHQEKQLSRMDIEGNANTINYDGLKIQLSTIHSVKGETHDATLVLETKNYNCDIQAMLEYLTKNRPSTEHPNDSLKENPTNVKKVEKMANQKFMRQLYVAMSRPKHLLCFAIHKDHITDNQKTTLASLGWNVVILQNGKA